ncbi:sigma 54-interacting transcriptional regulator [Chryseolinea sp. T2]|uniref:sigma 54-interacting transcriptional regulator n=1 Tax=Chryseolinea sp. T2 TaxID=3129255 RepID=UPI0030788D5F
MEEFYRSFGLVSCGVSLAMGSVYLYLGSLRKSVTYLLFGVMGFSLFIFFLMPPLGFILDDTPPYTSALLVKRLFIFAYYGITPWFIIHYSGYPKKWPAYVLSALVVLCYLLMAFTPESPEKPFWAKLAVLHFAGILILGLVGARHLHSQHQETSSRSLYIIMALYAILVALTAVNQFTEGALGRLFNFELFFPIHFHSLFFILIMGQHLVLDLFERFRLEEQLHHAENRLKSFFNNAPFIVMETDEAGKILSINKYGALLLGYSNAVELVGVNWFDHFVERDDRLSMEQLHQSLIKGETERTSSIRTIVKARNGESLTISWATFIVTDESGCNTRMMGVGQNITDEEKAEKLVEQLKSELAKEQLPEPSNLANDASEIIGSSKALTYALQKAGQVATTHAPVLLEGETGVGKELFANFIHEKSSRSKRAFVKINCGALPKELIEDELFGHEKGAFTSAVQVRKGRFELADGGTLFLDEIGELPLDMQPKLLRVLQSGEFERIGGQKTIKVNVRILAATNRTLSAEVQNGTFRSDLYYRLSVFPITIPALRQRNEDLPTLIQHFIAVHSRAYNKSFQQVTQAGMRRLLDYEWPGNIRELKNVIERSVILSEGNTIRFDWWDSNENSDGVVRVEDNSLERIERDHILSVIEKCNWKINGDNGAAVMLNMNPNTLRSKMKRLRIARPVADERPQGE